MRGLRADVRRQVYADILDAAPVGDRGALADAGGARAETAVEADARKARMPCRVFTTSTRAQLTCERPGCGFTYAEHRRAWRSET